MIGFPRCHNGLREKTMAFQGGCACKAVRYDVAADPMAVMSGFRRLEEITLPAGAGVAWRRSNTPARSVTAPE